MVIIPTEYTISLAPDNPHTFAPQRVRVIAEECPSGGFWLRVRGENDEPDTLAGERTDEFYLNSEREIDELARALKRIMRAANKAVGYRGD